MGGARFESCVSSRTLRIVRVLQHSLPLERTWATRVLGGQARARGAGGRRRARYGSALSRRAPGRSPSLNVGGIQRPHAVLHAPTARTMRSTRAAPGRDAGRGDEAATRGPDGIHGCDPSPSARIVGGDVRYRTSVRSPTPHKVLIRIIRTQDADNATLHWDWNPVRRPKAVTGHGSAGRRPSLACTGGTSECRAAGRRPALAGPKARHCGARSVRAAQCAVRYVRRAAQQYAHPIYIIIYTAR